jgi:transcriptional regulator with XRE-family HTH domain
MKRSSYRDQDYAFGQTMLTLRTAIGLTQGRLAAYLGVSRQAVGDWEVGNSYPKAEHLKALIALGIQHQAFHTDQAAAEIHTLWKASHQKVLLDETWLRGLLNSLESSFFDPHASATTAHTFPSRRESRLDWGDALVAPEFYGREHEVATLSHWIIQERCRVVSVYGIPGIGKSALVVQLMHQLADHFDRIIFRSFRSLPPPETNLDDVLQTIAPQTVVPEPATLEARIRLLINALREQRVLIVIDNVESLYLEGDVRGRLRPEVAGYRQVLYEIVETAHQSCLLLTSREKPAALRIFESQGMPVRLLWVEGLDIAASVQLLNTRGVTGSLEERSRLAELYGGNPSALKIVAETILELFEGQIGRFLAQDFLVFGSIADLIREQIERLSTLELMLLRWLTIARAPIKLEALRLMMVTPPPLTQVLEAIDALRRRSLIEYEHEAGTFTLPPLLMEYMTNDLVSEATHEIQDGRLALLMMYEFTQVQASEDVRQAQERLLVTPILTQLKSLWRDPLDIQTRLKTLLDPLRGGSDEAQGYGSSNLVTMLRLL